MNTLPFVIADQPTPDEQAALLAHASALLEGGTPRGLSGRKLALLCDDPASPDAALFSHAATALGAHVAQVHPALSDASAPAVVRDTALMLGRLYDAVECQGVAHALVLRLQMAAGVPVFNGCATAAHASAALVLRMAGSSSAQDKRIALLQALLLQRIARGR